MTAAIPAPANPRDRRRVAAAARWRSRIAQPGTCQWPWPELHTMEFGPSRRRATPEPFARPLDVAPPDSRAAHAAVCPWGRAPLPVCDGLSAAAQRLIDSVIGAIGPSLTRAIGRSGRTTKATRRRSVFHCPRPAGGVVYSYSKKSTRAALRVRAPLHPPRIWLSLSPMSEVNHITFRQFRLESLFLL